MPATGDHLPASPVPPTTPAPDPARLHELDVEQSARTTAEEQAAETPDPEPAVEEAVAEEAVAEEPQVDSLAPPAGGTPETPLAEPGPPTPSLAAPATTGPNPVPQDPEPTLAMSLTDVAGPSAKRRDPAAPAGGRSRSMRPLVVVGVLGVLALGAGAFLLASGEDEQAARIDPPAPASVSPPDGTEVTLPDSVLELPQAVGLSLTLQQALAPGLAGAFVDPQIGVYAGEPETETVTVYAGGARESDPAAGLDAFRATYDAGAENDLGEGAEVDPGELGGVARCWLTDFGQQPLGVCAFVDARTVVVLVDSIETEDLDAVAERGREVREATVT